MKKIYYLKIIILAVFLLVSAVVAFYVYQNRDFYFSETVSNPYGQSAFGIDRIEKVLAERFGGVKLVRVSATTESQIADYFTFYLKRNAREDKVADLVDGLLQAGFRDPVVWTDVNKAEDIYKDENFEKDKSFLFQITEREEF